MASILSQPQLVNKSASASICQAWEWAQPKSSTQIAWKYKKFINKGQVFIGFQVFSGLKSDKNLKILTPDVF